MNKNPREERPTFSGLFKLLLKYKILLVIMVLVVLGVAIYYLENRPERYEFIAKLKLSTVINGGVTYSIDKPGDVYDKVKYEIIPNVLMRNSNIAKRVNINSARVEKEPFTLKIMGLGSSGDKKLYLEQMEKILIEIKSEQNKTYNRMLKNINNNITYMLTYINLKKSIVKLLKTKLSKTKNTGSDINNKLDVLNLQLKILVFEKDIDDKIRELSSYKKELDHIKPMQIIQEPHAILHRKRMSKSKFFILSVIAGLIAGSFVVVLVNLVRIKYLN